MVVLISNFNNIFPKIYIYCGDSKFYDHIFNEFKISYNKLHNILTQTLIMSTKDRKKATQTSLKVSTMGCSIEQHKALEGIYDGP